MKRLTIHLSLFVTLFSCSTNVNSDNSALRVALNDFKQGDLISCQSKLTAYTQKFPQDYQGWSFLGTVAMELEKDSLAKVVFDKSLTLNPKDYKALTGLGVLERKNKHYDKAADYYNQAISINPSYAKAYGSLLIIELKRGHFQKAVELGESATRIDSEDLGVKGNLAVAYHFAKQLEKRDALVDEITAKGYPDADYLKLIFEGVVSLDDL